MLPLSLWRISPTRLPRSSGRSGERTRLVRCVCGRRPNSRRTGESRSRSATRGKGPTRPRWSGRRYRRSAWGSVPPWSSPRSIRSGKRRRPTAPGSSFFMRRRSPIPASRCSRITRAIRLRFTCSPAGTLSLGSTVTQGRHRHGRRPGRDSGVCGSARARTCPPPDARLVLALLKDMRRKRNGAT